MKFSPSAIAFLTAAISSHDYFHAEGKVRGMPVKRMHDQKGHRSLNMMSGSGSMGGDCAPAPLTTKPPPVENPCKGKKPNLPNVECFIDAFAQTGAQSGVNVTKGYNGSRETTAVPIITPFFEAGLCPVNVHWHLGAEHYSAAQFDETGSGPFGVDRLEVRQGFQCKLFDESDAIFTTPFDWQHCKDMEVGQTYEVHWPHSAAGACGTLNQYQTPFYDGVFCRDGLIHNTAAQIGVQAQVFTIVNDESYYYPDLMRGMIVDGDKGHDVAMYTGSFTGQGLDNEICSPYSPIT